MRPRRGNYCSLPRLLNRARAEPERALSHTAATGRARYNELGPPTTTQPLLIQRRAGSGGLEGEVDTNGVVGGDHTRCGALDHASIE